MSRDSLPRPKSATARIIDEDVSVIIFNFQVKVDMNATHSISSSKELFKDLTPVNTIQEDSSSSSSTNGNFVAGIGTLVFHVRMGTGCGPLTKIELPDSFYIPSHEGMTLLQPQHWAQVTQTQITWALFRYYHSDIANNEPREESKEGGSPPPPGWSERYTKYQSTNHQPSS